MGGLEDDDLKELVRLGEILETGTYYQLFGIEREFERRDLRTSYYELSRRFHPDRYYRVDLQGKELLLETVFAGINLAYKTLDDPGEKSRYERDLVARGLAAKGLRPPPPAPKRPEAVDDEPSTDVLEDEVDEESDTYTVSFDGDAQRKKADEDKKREARARRRKRRKKNTAPPAVQAFRQKLLKRLKKARRYHDAGLEEEENGNWSKASSSFYLAHQYDPKNADYKAKYEQATHQARQGQVVNFIAMARNAEDYGSHREAISWYEKAVALEPDDGTAFYRLGTLLRRLDVTDKNSLDNLRTAVLKNGKKAEWRVALAEAFEDFDMRRNANREFKAALDLDPGNESAKAGVKRTR